MQPFKAILFKVGSVCIFMAMASIIKTTSAEVPPGQQVFFRSFFAIPVIVAWLLMRGELRHGLETANPLGHLWRGLIGTCGMALGFAGLGLLPLPEVTAIGYAAPLLVVIFASMFLGEQVRAFRLGAVGLGLVGVLVIISPRLSLDATPNPSESLGVAVVLGAALSAALAQVFVRKLVMVEKTATIVFWFSVTASVLSLATLWWGWVWPAPATLALLIAAGLFGGVGQIFLTSSYRYAEASLIAPFDYVSMLLALVIGWFFFDEVPTLMVLGGAALIISAGVLIIWRESYLGLERTRQRKAMPPGGS